MQSLGLIETKGMLAAIEAADAMLKAADVGILGKIKVGGGRMNVSVTGDVAAVKAAVDAGMAAVDRLGSGLLLSGHVIARMTAEHGRKEPVRRLHGMKNRLNPHLP